MISIKFNLKLKILKILINQPLEGKKNVGYLIAYRDCGIYVIK